MNSPARTVARPPAVMTSRSGSPITSVSKIELMAELEAAGVVLLSGFTVDVDSFSKFVAANSSRVTLDPHRRFHSPNAQLVDAGNQDIEMHSENANTPFRPDFIWFYCNRAALIGGQTTFCDGLRVWAGLSDATRHLFSERKIEYRRTYAAKIWRAYVAHLLGDGTAPSDVIPAHVQQILGEQLGVELRFNEDDSLDTCYSRAAYYPTLFGKRIAFTNSMVGPYGDQRVTWNGGGQIPSAIIDEIRRMHQRFTVEIPWQDQDVALIDNTRFLHGRKSFTGDRRQIFAALSFA